MAFSKRDFAHQVSILFPTLPPEVMVTRNIRPVGGIERDLCTFENPAWMQSRRQFAILKLILRRSFPAPT